MCYLKEEKGCISEKRDEDAKKRDDEMNNEEKDIDDKAENKVYIAFFPYYILYCADLCYPDLK